MYTELASEHPIDLCRYQVANGYMGRVGLINSGGESHGESDLRDAVITAVVYKRAEKVGFTTSRYFSTAFKQYTGETPTQYKEKQKQERKKEQ